MNRAVIASHNGARRVSSSDTSVSATLSVPEYTPAGTSSRPLAIIVSTASEHVAVTVVVSFPSTSIAVSDSPPAPHV
jgi:hypothetical protein